MTLRLLIDSSVWLDILKDQRLDPVLTAIEELIMAGEITLIVPEQVLFEFDRNKERVKHARKNTLLATVKRFREALTQIDSDDERDKAMDAVTAIDHKLALTADTSERVIERILGLMAKAPVTAITDGIMLKAATRSLNRSAPCHQTKNSIADAIILETYLAAIAADTDPEAQFAFVSSNTDDFSHPAGDKRLPHPELAQDFIEPKSVYSTLITEVIRQIDSDMLEEFTLGDEYYEEPRKLSELIAAENLLFRQVWYNRHWNLRQKVASGEIKLVKKWDYQKQGYRADIMTEGTWQGALEAAKRTEEEVGEELLGPWDAFDWGMLNGKLSAIRWVLGSEWDQLDT